MKFIRMMVLLLFVAAVSLMAQGCGKEDGNAPGGNNVTVNGSGS